MNCWQTDQKNFVWKVPLIIPRSEQNDFLTKCVNEAGQCYIYIPTDNLIINPLEIHYVFFYEIETNRILFHGTITNTHDSKFPHKNHLYIDVYNRPFANDVPSFYHKVLFKGLLINNYLEKRPTYISNWNPCTYIEMMLYKNTLYVLFYDSIHNAEIDDELTQLSIQDG